jgi:membrane protease YdiL (CAAX protease family)
MRSKYIILSSIAACSFLYLVEQVLMVDYFVKTASKIFLFVLIPLLFIRYGKKNGVSERNAKLDMHDIKLGLLFGAASFAIVLVSYYILGKYMNIQGIISELQNKSKITPANFIFVGAYITFGNSFLEEFFFRGFIFLNLFKTGYKKTAYIFSSILFGLYHIAIFRTWFNTGLTLLALFGLVSIGLIFDWLDTKSDNFINSWIVHILADSAIIIIGMKMFGII